MQSLQSMVRHYLPYLIISIIDLSHSVTPTITSSDELVVVNEFDSASFQCNTTGIPRPGISWFRNGTRLLNSSRISISSPLDSSLPFNLYQVTQTLTINITTDRDSGNYSCVGNNSVGMDTSTVALVVQCKCYKITSLKLSCLRCTFSS